MPSNYKSLVLLGPDIQTFWPHFINQVEYLDGDPDPLDRWSVRIISGWAETLKAKAVYPFNGPPYPPFYNWALRSGSCHRSPLHMLGSPAEWAAVVAAWRYGGDRAAWANHL